MHPSTGVGPTEILNLRVSVAALVRLLFAHPVSRVLYLVLERTATQRVLAGREEVMVSARPLGGGLRLLDPAALHAVIGDFHYDSLRSRQQGDFRLCVRQEDWPRVQGFCLHHLGHPGGALEADPRRELVEEFTDSLGVDLRPEQYTLQPENVVIESVPLPTCNLSAAGLPTVRLYQVHSGRLLSPGLVDRVMASSASISDEDLCCQALNDASQGGKGRANALLALPLDEFICFCSDLPPDRQERIIIIDGHLVQSSVLALLPEVSYKRYLRLPNPGCW